MSLKTQSDVQLRDLLDTLRQQEKMTSNLFSTSSAGDESIESDGNMSSSASGSEISSDDNRQMAKIKKKERPTAAGGGGGKNGSKTKRPNNPAQRM